MADALQNLSVHADFLSSIDEILDDARNGRMFILVDDEDRENEGDLVIPAQFATPEQINFMARYGRGLICLALTRERVERLGLPLMSRQNASRHQTAFTVSIEAKEGVTTGISVADRAHTIAVAIDPTKGRDDIARLNADGSVDGEFRPMSGTGPAENYLVYAVALESDQRLLIGGRFSAVNAGHRSNIARLHR